MNPPGPLDPTINYLAESEMSSFQIQQFTRVHDDPCDQAVQNKEAAGPGSYQVTNLVPAQTDAYGIAYQQPAVPAAK